MIFLGGLWFPDKISESAKAGESNQINLNTRDIAVVPIGFSFFDYNRFMSEERGRKSTFEKCLYLENFFRHNKSLVNILLII